MSRANAPRIAALSVMLALALLAGVVLERVGVPLTLLSGVVLAFFLMMMLIAALSGSTMQPAVYFAGSRAMPPALGGTAFAAAWISTGILLAVPAVFTTRPILALAILCGSVGGVLLQAVAAAPGFRRSGAYSLADFIRWRTRSRVAGGIAALVSIALLFGIFCLQLAFGRMVLGEFVPVQPLFAMLLAAGAVLMSVWPGGLASSSRAQAFAWGAIVIGVLAPLIVLLNSIGFVAVYETLIAAPAQQAEASGSRGLIPQDLLLIGGPDSFGAAMLALAVAFTIAIMPPLLGIFTVMRSQNAIRGLALWAIVLMTMPVFGVTVLMKSGAVMPPGTASQTGQMFAPLGLDMPTGVSIAFSIAVLAAALSTAMAALHAISSTIAHDLYRPLADRYMTAGYRLFVARAAALVTAAAGGYIAMTPDLPWMPIIACLVALSAGVLFPVVMLALWWRRLSKGGAIAGLLLGASLTAYILASQQIGQGIFPAALEDMLVTANSVFNGNRSGYPITVVLPSTLIATIVFSLMSRRPDHDTGDQLALLRDGNREPLLNRNDFAGRYPAQKRVR